MPPLLLSHLNCPIVSRLQHIPEVLNLLPLIELDYVLEALFGSVAH
jgi:hypothetical protein